MSKTFKSDIADSDRAITVTNTHNFRNFAVRVLNGGTAANVVIPISDAPALALAILESAGFEDDPGKGATPLRMALVHLKDHVMIERNLAEEAAALEKLTKRRGELAVEYFEGAYDHLPRAAYQRAIDRIIELEDKAQS